MYRYLLVVLAAAACLLLPVTAQSKGAKLGVVVSAQSAAANATVSPYTSFDFNWNYTANLPVCVSTSKACYDGFILTNTTTGAVVGSTSQIGPTALSYNYNQAGGIPYGTTDFSLVAHGFDETGAAIMSTPATTTVVIKVTALNAPTGLVEKSQ